MGSRVKQCDDDDGRWEEEMGTMRYDAIEYELMGDFNDDAMRPLDSMRPLRCDLAQAGGGGRQWADDESAMARYGTTIRRYDGGTRAR